MFEFGDELERLRAAWDQVRVVRPVEYTLFTFGESVLEYYLVTEAEPPARLVKIRKGEVRITRPLLLNPHDFGAQLENFFEDEEQFEALQFLIGRSAAFSNLRLTNLAGPSKIVSDHLEEAVAKLQRQLDDEDEDRIAILTAPVRFGGLAIFKYTTDRILQSTPGNIQELRERGLLPE